MTSGRFIFGEFALDPGDRRLVRDGKPLELGSRYLDALALLLAERGRLVAKDRFMDEVWDGVPVTDEALTQCIRALRRELGDDAANPRFIETVPKHGYRFIAEVEWEEDGAKPSPAPPIDWPQVMRTGGLGAIGGGVAGIGGGLFYGFAASAPDPATGMGALSILLVLVALSTLLGIAGGAGVGIGIAVARFVPSPKWQWSVAGGMFGGLIVGALAKLVGLDGFELLFGRAPEAMTGSAEGALLGCAVGLADWFARGRSLSLKRCAAAGAAVTGLAGLLIPLLKGHLLGGSLNLLAQSFPDSRFRLDGLGSVFGENGFGPISEAVTSTLEGALFGLCMAAALALARARAA